MSHPEIRVGEIFLTPTFKLAGFSAATFAICILILFALIYWQTGLYETQEIDRFIVQETNAIRDDDAAKIVHDLTVTAQTDSPGRAYAALFDQNKHLIDGNLLSLPKELAADGQAHHVRLSGIARVTGDSGSVRAVARLLPNGNTLVIGRGVGELDELQYAVIRALEIGVLPALVLSLVGGAILSWRTLTRVRLLHRSVEKIMGGNLGERLPVRGTDDDFDLLASSVNRMLDEIGRLLDEIKSVGDDIAHDLRTPLTRVRARLERGRDQSVSRADLEATLATSIKGLDQALAIVTALLRITELEDGRRRAAFCAIDLADVLREIHELYAPIAELKAVSLVLGSDPSLLVSGDRELLIEAFANIVDNAIKFTPEGGHVRLSITDRNGSPVIRVTDNGPGISLDEREAVLRRFYRSDRSRHLPGSGLGLGLVSAITRLHNFSIVIDDAEPGCLFDVVCPAARYRDPAKDRYPNIN